MERRLRLRQGLYRFLWAEPVRALLQRVPWLRRIYGGWTRVHPFDTAHGVDTSGFVSALQCADSAALAAQISPYGGSQPSIVRGALALLPDPAGYAFVDLGCGKGRPLLVASELPYRRLLGIELSASLAAVARANAAIVGARHPERARIDVQVGDATCVLPAADRVVYFMYHAFGELLVVDLVDNLEHQLRGPLHHAFFVYYNPVHGAVFDRSPRFRRWSAQTLPYAPAELGYGPDIEDTVVIWQSVPEQYPARDGAARGIRAGPAQRSSLEALGAMRS